MNSLPYLQMILILDGIFSCVSTRSLALSLSVSFSRSLEVAITQVRFNSEYVRVKMGCLWWQLDADLLDDGASNFSCWNCAVLRKSIAREREEMERWKGKENRPY